MARILLYGSAGAEAVFLNATGPAADGSFTLQSLQLPNSPLFKFADTNVSGANVKALATAGDFQFISVGAGLTITQSLQLANASDQFQFFGMPFDATVTLSARLLLNTPASGSLLPPGKPFFAVRVCGRFQISATPVQFSNNSFCCQVELPALPELPASAPFPRFRLRLPSLGIDFPDLSLSWTFPNFPKPPFHLPGISLPSLGSMPVSVSYLSIDAAVTPGTLVIDIHHLRIAGKVGAIEGDLHAVFTNGNIDVAASSFRLYQPDFDHALNIPLSSWSIAQGCMTLGWDGAHFRELIALVLPDVAQSVFAEVTVSEVFLRVLADATQIIEVRLDWKAAPSPPVPPTPPPLTIKLPGFEVALPVSTGYTLMANLIDPRVILAATLNGEIEASSTFTWTRGTQRELLRDDTAATPTFAQFKATTKASVALALIDLPLAGGAPRFFRQLSSKPVPLGTDCARTDMTSVSMQAASWNDGELKINSGSNFKFPFLRGKDQDLTITVPATFPIHFTGSGPVVSVPLTVAVKVGTLGFATTFKLDFALESFAFSVADGQQLDFQLKSEAKGEFLGLHWRFLGPKGESDGFTIFTLVITGSNYQLKQGAGAVFQLTYDKATTEGSPIVFSVQEFALGPKGIDLAATVAPQPAKLGAIDTEFTFRQGSFQIRENHITDFSISGSGPLPPALVGAATADITLQFHQDDSGTIKLANCVAKLEGKNLLKCQSTRFQFSVDGLGLRFVEDGGRYHLYFTITGTAKFVPLDGDDDSGPLAWLPKIELRLMECPLTGDARVVSKHVQFLIEMPRKMTFSLLGCFEMEIRAIGFVPQAPMFSDDTSAMRLAGQIRFAEGGGDVLDARIDFHDLFVALPEPGSIIPRIYCKELGVKLKVGEAFMLAGEVEFLDKEEIQPGVIASGFRGQGTLSIQGLPQLAASFAFLRVSDDGGMTWKRAWFVYLEIDKVSFEIPVVEIYIREVGLGFGYRYTLAMIKASDEIDDPRLLIKELQKLSISQGDLSHFDQWRVDIGPAGDPRFTVVLRALISQTSATRVPTQWLESKEKELPCLFIFDTVIALRSDLTFLMTARGWLNTNYWDYQHDPDGSIRRAPLVSGFVLLSPRQKRFLAHVGSNQNAEFGDHPPLPEFLKTAIKSCYFTATLLIEPGLIHYELGWPNMLRWKDKLGPLEAEFRGGTIFRASRTELVVGNSFEARGSLDIESGVDLGFIGARLTAHAQVAYGARYIGVIGFDDPVGRSAFYAVEGIDIRVTVKVEFWLKIELLFDTIKLDFNFSFGIAITASVQVGIVPSLGPPFAGIRGAADVSLNIMGHGLHFGISIATPGQFVERARQITDAYLSIGLEATDVQPIPGEPPPPLGDAPPSASTSTPTAEGPSPAAALQPAAIHAEASEDAQAIDVPLDLLAATAAAVPKIFITPQYTIFSVPPKGDVKDHFFLLMPGAARNAGDKQLGFFPPPPSDGITPSNDMQWTLPQGTSNVVRMSTPTTEEEPTSGVFTWKCKWNEALTGLIPPLADATVPPIEVTVGKFFRYAYLFVKSKDHPGFGDVTPTDDPEWPHNSSETMADERVNSPSESNYEAAVRGAADQISSPKFKSDPSSPYDQTLSRAWSLSTSVYPKTTPAPSSTTEDFGNPSAQAVQSRSGILHIMIQNVQKFAANPAGFDPRNSLAFLMGVVFKVKGQAPDWLLNGLPPGETAGRIVQRQTLTSTAPDSTTESMVEVFNTDARRFDKKAPRFERVRQFSDANTIAIAWDLAWEDTSPADKKTDPEQHLQYYIVRRQSLDSSDRVSEYQVRPAEVLHQSKQDKSNPVTRLRPRFNVIDHFNHETAEDQAALPPQGRTYLYTITPVDIAGHFSQRPLTVVVTRRPQEPPLVPSDANLYVRYTLTKAPEPTAALTGRKPNAIDIDWTLPSTPEGSPRVAAAEYRLLFRRETTLPIGSYGLDSSAAGSQAKGLPVSNARPLRTDILVKIEGPGENRFRLDPVTNTKKEFRSILLAELPDHLLPADGQWRPDSWRVFLQAQSNAGVWSTLAPVQISLCFALETPEQGRPPIVRHPSSLEWIPEPIALPPLPPEDQSVRIGFAEVPMPVVFSFQPADNTVDFIHYAVHPDKPRALGFRWNQGPSSTGAVPPDLNAGYDVYEFDLDAHSPEDFSALRLIQEVDLLAADEVARTPHDTLVPDRWEAWYPAAFMRMQLARTQRLKVPLSNWYSWRDSILVWPPAQQTFSKPDRRAEMHSFLIRLVDALRKTEKDRDTVIVDVNPIPATIPGDLAAFMSETAPRIDPYGWRILQRMGLSICISLRRPEDGSYYSGAEVLKQIREQLAIFAAGNDENKQDYLALLPHLHVEHLFQPGQSVTLATSDDPQPGDVDERKVAETGLLDIVQISLRPYAQQVYHYASVEFVVPLASPQPFTDLVTFQVTDHNPITVIQYTSWSSSDSKSGGNQEQSVAVAEKDKVSVVAPVSLDAPINVPTDRQVKLLIRGESVGQAAGSVRVFFKGVELVQKPFEPSAPPSGYFTAPSGDLNRKFELIGDLAASQWELLRVYLTQAGVTRPAHLRDNISILSWLARFLDLSHDAKGTGPWLATGYPRLVSPVALTPDKSGRISYFHLVTDSYAHVFRYYVRPRGRYDLLWQSIVSSRLFGSADQPMKPLALALSPEKGTGGLDVVLDRIHEITPPLVLGSRRIDPKPATADPVPPGSIWEVIVAKHPEQELIERNRTLARHLSYRQIAYTMMRTFAYQKQLTELKTILKHQPSVPPYDFEKRQVEGPPTKPLLPGAYPAPETERLDLSKEEDLRALDLPERLGPFGQGAQVLQWRALPYFYKQRLLLVAQAAHIHSDATEILQQDFEYRSPVPNVLTEGFTRNTPPTPETVNPAGRVRRFHIELASYWKCLPPEARAQWKIENSDFVDPVIGNQTVKRMYSSLPELSAIYQFLLNGDAGVTEALNEVFYVPGTGFAARQFNKDIPLTVKEIEIPDRNVNHQAPMFLMALLTTSATITLRRIVDANGKPLPLGISGDFTRIDRNRILLPSIPDFEALASKPPANAPPENIDRFLARWYAARSVSHEVTIPRNLPLFGKVEFREADGFVLVQHGSQPAELDAWAATVDPALAASIQSLKTTDLTATTQVVVRKFLAQSDFPLSLRHQVAIKDDEVIWTGPVTPLQLTALDSMIAAMPAQGPGRRGLEDLRDRLHTDRSFPAQPERFPGAPPKQADLVALLSNPLTGIILDTFPAPENKFSIRWAGISNLGEPVEALLTRIAVKIPNPADNIRTALESIFREIAAFQSTGRIPGVPPALAAMVSLNRYLLHLNELPQDRQALIDLFANSPLDQAAVNRLYLDLEDQHTLDHYLAGWISEQPISASKVFPQSASWQDRIEFPLPNSCVLAVSVPLTGGEIAQLMAIDADVGFKEALQQLASGRRTAQAPVGLEQLIELAPAVEIPTSANRNITWHGPLRRTMRATLTKWIATSPFNATLTALLAALGQWRFDDTFDATGEYPRQSELDPAIRSRLIVSAGTIGWNGLALDFDEEAALNALAADLSWSASFRAGVTKLLNTIRVSVAVVVPVTEADWKPRPRQGAVLPDKLLIGNALVRFHGLMTRDDGQALQKDQSAPDRAAIQRLFDASMRGGLNGGELVARARLGSAKIETSPLNTTLT